MGGQPQQLLGQYALLRYPLGTNFKLVSVSEYYVPSKIAKGNGQIKTCSQSDYPQQGEVCEVDVRDWGDCNRDQFYSYHKNQPCIFLKLNKIYGWTPEYYDDPYNLPQEMPESLKSHIRSLNNTRDVIRWPRPIKFCFLTCFCYRGKIFGCRARVRIRPIRSIWDPPLIIRSRSRDSPATIFPIWTLRGISAR